MASEMDAFFFKNYPELLNLNSTFILFVILN